MKSLIIINGGLGNGMIIDPILRTIDKTVMEYYLTFNEWINNNKVAYPGLQGFVPNDWRRFTNQDELLRFLREANIDTLINARKEDRQYDKAYFQVKEMLVKNKIDVFDLYNQKIPNYIPIGHQIVKLFEEIEQPILKADINWRPLEQMLCEEITFYVGASIPKKVPVSSYLRPVIQKISKEFSDRQINIVSGIFPFEEKVIAEYADLNKENVRIYRTTSLNDAAEIIGKSLLCVTLDTSISHLSSLMGIDTITIFTSTNGQIWRNNIQDVEDIIQSKQPLYCKSMKEDGTCTSFYKECDLCRGQDLDYHVLVDKIRSKLNHTLDKPTL
jgi:ADP-heptose:LPS heptosyltransferase